VLFFREALIKDLHQFIFELLDNMKLRFEIPKKEDIDLFLEFYNQLSIDEGRWQL